MSARVSEARLPRLTTRKEATVTTHVPDPTTGLMLADSPAFVDSTDTRKRTAAAGRSENEQKLAELARRHAVCYDVWPDKLVTGGQNVQVGFDLELLGVNEAHDAAEAPGCPRCVETYEDLRCIAEWLLPPPGRPTRCEIAPFEAAWHATPSRRLRAVASAIEMWSPLMERSSPRGVPCGDTGAGTPLVTEPVRSRTLP
jgi:hypothetical protein